MIQLPLNAIIVSSNIKTREIIRISTNNKGVQRLFTTKENNNE